jgi:hypothetical protein
VPPHERIGTHDRQQLAPSDKLRQEDECDPRCVVRAARSDLAFDVTRKLLPEEEVLRSQLRSGPDHQPQQAQQPVAIGVLVSRRATALLFAEYKGAIDERHLRKRGVRVQFSSFSLRTRSNSAVLFVTSVRPSARAWAAMNRSLAPISVPRFFKSARISA